MIDSPIAVVVIVAFGLFAYWLLPGDDDGDSDPRPAQKKRGR